MGNVFRNIIAPAAGVGADFLRGLSVDREAMVRRALAEREQKVREDEAALHRSIADRSSRHLDVLDFVAQHPQPKMSIVATDQGIARVPTAGEPGIIAGPNGKPLAKPVTEKAPSFTALTATGADGKPVIVPFETHSGTVGKPLDVTPKMPSNTGAAAIQGKVATNRVQLSVIADALKELNAHPDAIGVKRGLGEMVPILGGVQDAANQRLDPGGVAARAQIANIGSLKMHDRSGAAVTISEFPRLKPFIPSAADTPEAARVKLQKLAEGIQLETQELLRANQSTSTPPTQPSGATGLHATPGAPAHPANAAASRAQQLWDAAVAIHGREKVEAEYGPRPND